MAVLEVRDLAKQFGGIHAVEGVSFDVNEGEILGIIGPNGSGKSTLFNCILGQLHPSAGEVRLDGRAVTGMRPCDLNRLGVSRTFQLLQVFPELTVRENLILAAQEHKGSMLARLFGFCQQARCLGECFARVAIGVRDTRQGDGVTRFSEIQRFARLERLHFQVACILIHQVRPSLQEVVLCLNELDMPLRVVANGVFQDDDVTRLRH